MCNPSGQSATVTVPVATDVCSPTVTVTGAITSVNGQPASPPIPITQTGQTGTVTLPPGTDVITWTATDQSGNVSTVTQTLTVRPGVEANGSISIDNGATVATPGGGFAAIGNTGTGLVQLSTTATTGRSRRTVVCSSPTTPSSKGA